MTDRRPPETPEPIEDYLDGLLLDLRLPARDTRRLLAEAEAHLRETAERLQDQGMATVEAEREAIRRFGPARQVAVAAGAARRPAPLSLVVQGSLAFLTLSGVGLASVGLSGALAALANAVAGPRLMGALPQTYSASTCAGFLATHPRAASCAQAAIWENSHDAVALRLLAGVVGVALLAVAWAWRRFSRGDDTAVALRDGATAAVAAVAFGIAAVFLIGTSVDIAVQHGLGGVGYYLTGGIVASAGALLAVVRSHHSLRRLRPWRLAARQVPA